MINGNLFQFDDYQQQVQQQPIHIDTTTVGDIKDYLTCDLKLSDTIFNDLFSEFDLNPNYIPYFDPSTNTDAYYQHSAQVSGELPPSYDSTLLSTNISQTAIVQPVIENYLSSTTFKTLPEQDPAQQTIVKYCSSPPPSVPTLPTAYSEPSSISSMNESQTQSIRHSHAKKSTSGKRSRVPPPAQLPKLIKKPEPIPVTLDQFQALIRSASDTSNSNVGPFSSLLENSTIIGNNIPLKIINQTNINSMSSDENSRQDSPANQQSTTSNTHFINGANLISGGGRIRRKSSHNAIEKRYRSSINERILELKEIVADDDEKVQKSGVLRRTVEYIRQLQSVNRRLEEENNTLKTILKQLNLKPIDIPNNNDNAPASSLNKSSLVNNPTTPPSSHSDSSESTLGSSDEAFSPVPKRQKRTTSKQGMVNGSRLILCCFMLCVIVTNPFNYLLNFIHSSDYNEATEVQSIVGSRTLQAAVNNDNINSSTFLSTSWRQLVAWMLNLAICLVCLVKLFVYGEPIVPESEMHEYYIHKKKADQLMAENRLNEARIYYRKCCENLYVTIDNTLLYYLSSITWQMTRLCVNLIVVGRWLTFWSGWTKSIDTRDYNRELNDCLLQLWKIEYQYSSSALSLIDLFISTINTSVNAGKKLDIKKHNEIYLLSALTLKKLGGIFSILIPYLLKCMSPMDDSDFWLVDMDRLNQFIFDKKYILFKTHNFIESIRSQYYEYIIYDNIQSQLLIQDNTQQQQQIILKNNNDLDQFIWWQHCLQVIRCISNNKQSIDNIISSDILRHSEESNQTIYYLARSMKIVNERYIIIVEAIHSILLVLNDDDDQTNSTRLSLLEQLGQSSRLITSTIENSTNDHNDDNLDLAVKTLLIDGILSLRLRLLTSTMAHNDQKIPYLNDFQQELDCYKQLNRIMKLPKQRVYLFESIYRVSSGLNPLVTQTLFECALKPQNSTTQFQEESPNLDIISALLLFCHFSPSTVYHYRNILQQAATISSTANKNNDLNRLRQQCLALVRQPYFTL
ncbi:unnamed protein product [Rotaria socialis]|uniref:BHLH domain-containing protein n=1 Tax=Rotaria socialis TaxID=392032 RepID=A0A820TX95_9BILA|nr:unnamed protein product [Rotaria socialis]CAF4473734.1 unnamed protein product [Rotaria socialis]